MKSFKEYCDQKDKEIKEGWVKNAALGAALVGSGMGIGRMTAPTPVVQTHPTHAVQTTPSSDIDPFWIGGVTRMSDGSVQAVGHGQSSQEARMQAYKKIAQFMGSNKIPPGVETTDQQEKDGAFRIVLTWSPQREQIAKQFDNSPSILQQNQ